VSSEHPNHDQLFKELLSSFFPEFLLLVAPRNAHQLKLEHGRFLDAEAFTDFPRGNRRQLDLIYETQSLAGVPETVLVHVEVEAQYRRSFDRRMAHYGLSLHLRTGNPVLPIALLLKGGSGGDGLGEGEGIGWKTVEMAVPGSWVNRFRYLVFSLSAASAEAYLARRDPLAAALSALMPYRSGARAEHKLHCLSRIAAARELNAVRAFQLANIVENYLQLEGTDQEHYQRLVSRIDNRKVSDMELLFDRMLRERHTEGLKQGRDLGLKQGRDLGLKQGRDLGLKQGRDLGVVEGARHTLLRLLTLRFGALPPTAVQRIEHCTDLEQLQQWSERVISAPDLPSVGVEG